MEYALISQNTLSVDDVAGSSKECDMSFDRPDIFDIYDAGRDRLADLLRETTRSLIPFTGHLSMPGYGTRATLCSRDGSSHLNMAPLK